MRTAQRPCRCAVSPLMISVSQIPPFSFGFLFFFCVGTAIPLATPGSCRSGSAPQRRRAGRTAPPARVWRNFAAGAPFNEEGQQSVCPITPFAGGPGDAVRCKKKHPHTCSCWHCALPVFRICWVPLRSALGHALCTMCVVEWATREEGVWSCPMCRGEDVGTWRSLPHHLGYS